MKIFILSLLLTLALAVIPVAAMAVEYGGVGGRPANPRDDNPRTQSIFVYELTPGSTFSDAVRVFNNTDADTTVSVGAVDSVGSSDGAFACAQEAEPKVGVGSWITLSRNSVFVPARENRTVDFTITVPAGASVGEQSGCITMQDVQQEPVDGQGGVVLSFRSAIRVAVTIPGDIVKSISFVNVELGANATDSKVYTIRPIIANSGNVSLDTKLDIRLVSLFGITEDSVTATYPILPGTTASWNFDVDRPFWGGLYRADVTAQYNDNIKDTLGQTSGGSETTISQSSALVYVAPTPLAAAIQLAGLALLVAGIVLLVRRLTHKRAVAKHWKNHTVQQGQSLQAIAKSHHVSWKKLATANKLRAPYHVEPGQVIKIPPKSE